MSISPTSDHDDFFDPELDLLGDSGSSGDGDGDSAADHAFRTAPVFTGDAFAALGARSLPQRALYGRLISQHAPNLLEHASSPKIYINTNAPFSALVCGVQGSGKSHSTSVLLESCLISDSRVGTLPAPLSAIVFHFDTAAGGGLVQPCEAAYLATVDATRGIGVIPPDVIVLVVPTYLHAMRKVYAGLPQVKVEPLLFSPEDISGERLLAMMKVDENTQMPLYMEAIMAILRSMEDNFDYVQFRSKLAAERFNASQKAMLNLRLSLLDSCMKGGDAKNRVSTHFKPGQLTIIDLSSPFMDSASACGFFDIILGLFVEAEISSGKLVVLDEAHKYLSESQGGSSGRLTESLLTVIRQQRHLATRVVISTQEPTVVPTKYLDLCSFIIAHRFSSPKWLRVLAEHVSAAGSTIDDLFDKIVALQTGQAIMFAPNALTVRNRPAAVSGWGLETEAGQPRTEGTVTPLGQGYFFVRSRFRVTRDGGHSLLAVDDPAATTRLGRVSGKGSIKVDSGMNGDTGRSWDASGSVSPTPTVAVPSLSDPQASFPQSPPGLAGASGQPPAAVPGVSSAPPLHAPTDSAPPLSQPTATTNVGGPQAIPPGAPTITLTGELYRFTPIVKYMQLVRSSGGKPSIPMATIQKRIPSREPGIYNNNPSALTTAIEDAITLGVIARTSGKKVQLIPGVHYVFGVAQPQLQVNGTQPVAAANPSSYEADSAARVYMAGSKQKFWPLVRYMQGGGIGATISTKTIRKYFRKQEPSTYGQKPTAINEVINAAVTQGVLVRVDDKTVRLLVGVEYVN